MTEYPNAESVSIDSQKTEGKPVYVPTLAIRKTCDVEGIGLSHYVLMDKKSAK